jgi:hypothetical protein
MTEKPEVARTPKKEDKTRGYTVAVPDALAAEIRKVATALGLPVAVVRDIATASATAALDGMTNGVRAAVASHFAKLAGGGQ